MIVHGWPGFSAARKKPVRIVAARFSVTNTGSAQHKRRALTIAWRMKGKTSGRGSEKMIRNFAPLIPTMHAHSGRYPFQGSAAQFSVNPVYCANIFVGLTSERLLKNRGAGDGRDPCQMDSPQTILCPSGVLIPNSLRPHGLFVGADETSAPLATNSPYRSSTPSTFQYANHE